MTWTSIENWKGHAVAEMTLKMMFLFSRNLVDECSITILHETFAYQRDMNIAKLTM